MTKKIIVLLCCIMMILGLVGCQEQVKDEKVATSSEVEKKEVKATDVPESSETPEFIWPSVGPAEMLPEPKLKNGDISIDTSDMLYADLYGATQDYYNKFVDECQRKGFDIDYSKFDTWFTAKHKKGYDLLVTFDDEKGSLEIQLSKLNDSNKK